MTEDTQKSTEWTLQLEYPVKVRGTEYNVLNFRRALARDIAFFSNTTKKDGDKMLHMAARLNLNGFSDDDMGNLDAQDFGKLMKKVGEMMGVNSDE